MGMNWGKSPKRIRKLRRIAEREGRFRCCWCNGHLTIESATIEHIIPLSRGGTNELRNLDMACIPCNTARGAPDGEVYEPRWAGEVW